MSKPLTTISIFNILVCDNTPFIFIKRNTSLRTFVYFTIFVNVPDPQNASKVLDAAWFGVSKPSSILVHESRDRWPIKCQHGAFAIEAAIYYLLDDMLACLLIGISTMDHNATPFPRPFQPPNANINTQNAGASINDMSSMIFRWALAAVCLVLIIITTQR